MLTELYCLEKFETLCTDEKLNLLYMWVKQGVLKREIFKNLLKNIW